MKVLLARKTKSFKINSRNLHSHLSHVANILHECVLNCMSHCYLLCVPRSKYVEQRLPTRRYNSWKGDNVQEKQSMMCHLFHQVEEEKIFCSQFLNRFVITADIFVFVSACSCVPENPMMMQLSQPQDKAKYRINPCMPKGSLQCRLFVYLFVWNMLTPKRVTF